MAKQCPTCARSVADDRDFCDCGEYLRWDATGVFQVPESAGAAVATPAPPVASPPALSAVPVSATPLEPVLLVLRLPGAPATEGPPRLQLAVESPGLLQGVVRNQMRAPESYTLRVSGLPPEWVQITPPAVDLLPLSSGGSGHESHFTLTITAPRSPQARAGLHSFQVEAVSRSTGAVQASVPATLEILAFNELALDASPEVRRGRRRVRFTLTFTASGNAPLDVEPVAHDRADDLTASCAPSTVRVEPGVPVKVRLTAAPRSAHLIGRAREHQLAVTADAAGVPPPPTKILTVRQRAWIPLWFPPLLILLVAAAAAYVVLRPKTATMPPLAGETFNAAQLATARSGFTQTPSQQTEQAARRSEIGTIVRQEPAAGEEARRDAPIVLVVAVGSGTARVPDLEGLSVDAAQGTLRRAGLKLGPVNGDAARGIVARQDPPGGERLDVGAGVGVRLAIPKSEPKPDELGRPGRAGSSVAPTGLRTLAVADSRGIYFDTGNGDALRLNTELGDSDPAWLADRVVFRRLAGDKGRLFVVDAAPGAEPEPLTPEGENWGSPAAIAGTLAAVHDGQVCVRVADWKCRALAGVQRVAWGSEGATLVALVRADDGAKVVRFPVTGDDPAAWGKPKELGEVARAGDVAASPEGVVVVAGESGLERVGGDRLAPGIGAACGIEFLDATRLAVAAGECGTDPRIRLVDVESGGTRALPGTRGEQMAFAAQ